MRSYSMARQLRIGAEGAARVKLLLARRFGVLTDYEGVREKQRAGIDLHIKPWGYVEVKTDLHDTHNFFFEYRCGDKASGVMISEADFWAYYLVNLKHIYMIPTAPLREWITKNLKWLAVKYKKEVLSHAGKREWSALGLALPRDIVCAALPVTIYTEYKDALWLAAGEEPRR